MILEKIGQDLGVTRERVRQVEKIAFGKMGRLARKILKEAEILGPNGNSGLVEKLKEASGKEDSGTGGIVEENEIAIVVSGQFLSRTMGYV